MLVLASKTWLELSTIGEQNVTISMLYLHQLHKYSYLLRELVDEKTLYNCRAVKTKSYVLNSNLCISHLTPLQGERRSCTSASTAPISSPTAVIQEFLSPWVAKLANARAT